MGLLQYDWDNETRLIHFCRHLVIRDRAPEIYDVVSGIWYVKEPSELGRSISASRINWTKLPDGIPRLVFSYFNRHLMSDGLWNESPMSNETTLTPHFTIHYQISYQFLL